MVSQKRIIPAVLPNPFFFLVFIDVKSRSINLNEWTKKKPLKFLVSLSRIIFLIWSKKKNEPTKKNLGKIEFNDGTWNWR
jgi:hypothetical protein